MFTGIIEEIGAVKKVTAQGDGRRFQINAKTILDDLKIDQSVAVNGVCLTVVKTTNDSFFADADNSFCVLMRLDLGMSDLLSKAKATMRENYATKMRERTQEALKNMDDAFAAQDARLNPPPDAFKNAKK